MPSNKEYTKTEVAKHNTAADCWLIIDGKVYDCSKFVNDHPGGKKILVGYAGKDASKPFNTIHNKKVIKKWGPKLIVGTLKK